MTKITVLGAMILSMTSISSSQAQVPQIKEEALHMLVSKATNWRDTDIGYDHLGSFAKKDIPPPLRQYALAFNGTSMDGKRVFKITFHNVDKNFCQHLVAYQRRNEGLISRVELPRNAAGTGCASGNVVELFGQ